MNTEFPPPESLSLTVMFPVTIDLRAEDQMYLDMCQKHADIVKAIKWIRMWVPGPSRRGEVLSLMEAKAVWDIYAQRKAGRL